MVDNAGGVGPVYENDVRWTCGTRFSGPIIVRNNVVIKTGLCVGIQSHSFSSVGVSLGYSMGIPTAGSVHR